MIHDIQQQKEDIEKVIQAMEHRIANHKMAITMERSLIKAVQVIKNFLVKIGPSSESKAPVITTDGIEL